MKLVKSVAFELLLSIIMDRTIRVLRIDAALRDDSQRSSLVVELDKGRSGVLRHEAV